MIDLADPNLDPSKLPIKDKIKLIKQCDGELVDLLRGERIDRSLYLYHCSSLRELPDGLEVGGHFDLTGCISLIKLSDGLKVGWTLWLTNCSSLRELPVDLEVGGNLWLSGCSSLPEELPKTIKVGGEIVR
jgi:hypothetical protein